jgi:predicted 3-demethylubiquinone-9 3-methyltransferase (glyoxalase superfamily)
MPNLSHMLWFNNQAEEAAQLYTNIFKDSKIINKTNGPDGGVFTVEFEILDSKYMALNGGPVFSFTEAFSIVVLCQDQSEVDKYWDALTSNGGSAGRCGWLKDKFGLSWQIIPKQLGECLGNPDPEKSAAAMKAMLGMSKLIISELEEAVK